MMMLVLILGLQARAQGLLTSTSINQLASDQRLQETLVTLKVDDRPLRDVLDMLERQTKYVFIYTDNEIMTSKMFSFDVVNKPFDSFLHELFEPIGIKYGVYKRQIVLQNKKVNDDNKKPSVSEPAKQTDFKEEEPSMQAANYWQAIKGNVRDENGGALPGVNVLEKGTNNGTITDKDGNYTLEVSPGAVLVFSFVGYRTQEVVSDDREIISIQMVVDAAELKEVVVIGYNSEKKRDLTGAVSIVNVDAVRSIPTSNPLQSLQGRVPGLYIESTGKPSGEASRVLIRGVNTLGNTDPLYIIDGVPTKSQTVLNNMSTSSIESIQVLKDASATSIYGSRASNGVIIITTKEGQNKLKVNVNSSLTSQRYTWQKIDVLNTEERGRALWQASINDKTDPAANAALYGYKWHTEGTTPVLDQVTPVDWIGGNAANKTHSANTDWQDVVYRNGLISNNDISLSAGNDQGALSMSVGYLKNQGIMRYTDFSKLSVRVNTSYNLFNDKLRIGENLLVASSTEVPEGRDLGGTSMTHLALWMQPILPVYTEDGDWAGPIGGGFSDRNNPLHMLYLHRNNTTKQKTVFGNVYGELHLMENLVFRSSLGVDYRAGHARVIEPSYRTGFLTRVVNNLTESDTELVNWTWSNTLNYRLEVKDNTLNFLLGTEAIHEDFTAMSAYRENFALQDDDYFFLSSGTGVQTNSGTSTGYRLRSFFGKVNYALKDKYLAALTVRYDGSSRFGKDNKFGLFPAMTLGWRLSDEKLFQNIKPLSNLKLRAGAGRVGNQDIGNNAWFGLYATNYGVQTQGGNRNNGTAYDLNGTNTGTLPSGYVAIQSENANLKWESTEEVNVGLDFGFFEDKLSGSVDLFSRKTSDILIQPPTPAVSGEGANMWRNGATVKNHGFELALGYQNTKGKLFYRVQGMMQAFRDRVVELPESVVRSYPGNVEKTIIGHSQTSMFGYVTDGIFQNQEEVNAHANQPGKGVGRIRYADLNGDGKIDPLDQTWLGTTLPKFEYGVNIEVGYKALTLSTFIQGVQGKSVYNTNKYQITTTYYTGMNFGASVLDAWTPQNTGSDIPALSNVNTNNENRSSDYYIVNGSYLKIRTLQLAYDLPTSVTQKLKIANLRVYVLGENLAVIKDKKGKDRFFGTDPEAPNLEYPRPTNVTVGFNLSF